MSILSRRDEIIRILLGISQTTIPCLAETLGVSESTIKRDILMLTVDGGFPIDTIQGHGGGVRLRDFRHPHMHILSKEQISVLSELAKVADKHTSEVLAGILRAYA